MKPKQRPDPNARFEPSQRWLDEFKRQYSGALAQCAERYAARRIAGVGAAPRPGTDESRQLAIDALSDTLMGTVRWDPDAKTLAQHLQDVIKRRTWIDWKRAKKFRHHSIDVTTADGDAPIMVEADQALRERLPDPQAAENAAEALAALRQHAADDPPLLAFIDAKEQGARTRAEVMRVTGLSPLAYRKVRRRLARLIEQLPVHLRPQRRKGD